MEDDNNRPKRIIGLKAIAEYLKTSPRNIYRWEKELGFPLHRVGGTKGRSVFVEVDELEEWLKKTDHTRRAKLKSSKISPRFRQLSLVTVILLLLVLIPFFIYLVTSTKSASLNPVTYEIFGKMVNLKNYKGETLWSFQAWHDFILRKSWVNNPRISLADINGDGFNEVITAPYHSATNQYTLTLFDHKGKEIWSKAIKADISFQGIRFLKDYIPIRNIFCKRRDGSWVIISAWRHDVRFVSTILTLSIEGQILSQFINPGHLSRVMTFDLDGDGEKEILVSATHNLLNGDGVLVVLPLVGYSGLTPPNRIEPEYQYRADFLKRYIADNTPLSTFKECLRFRKPSYLRELHETYTFATINDFAENRLSVYFYPWRILPQHIRLGFLIILDSQLNILDIVPESILIQEYNSLLLDRPTLPSLSELGKIVANNIFKWQKGQWVHLKQVRLNQLN